MSITHNPYLQEAFERHLLEKTAKAYCKSKGLSKSMAKAKAKRDLEKLANVPVFKNFLSGLGKALRGASDDLVANVNKGGTKIVATSADEAAAVTQKATGGSASANVAKETQALPKYQAATVDGKQVELGFGDKMRMHGANLLNTAAANPGMALAATGAGVGATGLATGAMLS